MNALNELLVQVAEEQGVRYVDVTPILADADGFMRDDYTYDGVHPSASGFLAIRDSIIQALV